MTELNLSLEDLRELGPEGVAAANDAIKLVGRLREKIKPVLRYHPKSVRLLYAPGHPSICRKFPVLDGRRRHELLAVRLMDVQGRALHVDESGRIFWVDICSFGHFHQPEADTSDEQQRTWRFIPLRLVIGALVQATEEAQSSYADKSGTARKFREQLGRIMEILNE